MKSMTGFGNVASKESFAEIEVTVKAVNGRFLETRLRFPKEYAHLENEAKRQIAKTLLRGSVDVFVARKVSKEHVQGEIRLNLEMAKKWSQAYQKLAKEIGYKAEPSLHMVVSAPEVLNYEEVNLVSKDEEHAFLSLLQKGVQACDEERQREGLFLKQELLGLLSALEVEVSRIEGLRHEVNQELLSRYTQRLNKLGLERNLDEQRLAQEVVILIDRMDITEEVTRLKEHIKIFRELLESEAQQGKKLDFYTQELLREMNTIGSKAQQSEVTQSMVNGKSLIERMREQVQNIE